MTATAQVGGLSIQETVNSLVEILYWIKREGWVGLNQSSEHPRNPRIQSLCSLVNGGLVGANIDESPVDNADATTHMTLTASPSPDSDHNHIAVPDVKVRASSLDR